MKIAGKVLPTIPAFFFPDGAKAIGDPLQCRWKDVPIALAWYLALVNAFPWYNGMLTKTHSKARIVLNREVRAFSKPAGYRASTKA